MTRKQKEDPCVKAPKLLKKGDTEGALHALARCRKSITNAIRASKEAETVNLLRIQYGRACRLEGQILLMQKQQTQAMRIFTKGIEMLPASTRDKDALQLFGEMYSLLGNDAAVTGDGYTALEQFTKSKDAFNQSKNYQAAVETYFRIISLIASTGDETKVIHAYDDMQSIAKHIKEKDIRKMVFLDIEFGQLRAKYRNGQIKDYPKELEKMRKKYAKQGNTKGEISVLMEQATIAPKEAVSYLQTAEKLAESVNDKALLGVVKTNLGLQSIKQGDVVSGKDAIIKGLEYRIQVGDQQGAAEAMLELARISYLTAEDDNELHKVMDITHNCLKIASTNNFAIIMAQALELQGSIESKLGSLNEATASLKSARKIYKNLGDKDGQARCLTQTGLVLGMLGERDDAAKVLDRALQFYTTSGNLQGQAEVHQIIGFSFEQLNAETAKEHLTIAIQLYGELAKQKPNFAALSKFLKERVDQL